MTFVPMQVLVYFVIFSVHFYYFRHLRWVGEWPECCPMTLNLGISDEAHDNNDGQEPLQFTQVMDTLRPPTDTGVRSKVVRLYELLSIEVGLSHIVPKYVVSKQ